VSPATAPGVGHEHLVEFYETEDFLVKTVADFISPPLHRDDAAVVAATAEHLAAFAAAIRREGVDLDAAVEDGRYVTVDADELLGAFMIDGTPDPALFRDTVGPLLDRLTANGRAVWVYGEMVAQLLAAGDISSTIALEDLWNDLARVRDFSLLCAYPMLGFDDHAGATFRKICGQHTTVIPADSYSLLRTPDEQHRVIAELQRDSVELARLREEHQALVQLSSVDALTGLANRSAFDAHLQREWDISQRHRIDSFVVFADLDGFKEINDSLGHAAGDEGLRQFAVALRLTVRSADIPARLGGDEFGVLLIRCDEAAAHRFGARLNRVLAEQLSPEFRPLRVSIGCASLLRFASSEKALWSADMAMLAQKRSERDAGADNPSSRPGVLVRR
jgi:diguanylate cyclase (GGDEF)-like protein